MAPAKSRAELEQEIRRVRTSRFIFSITTITTTAIRWCGLVAIAYLTRDTIINLAGKTTLARFGIMFFGELKTGEAISYALSILLLVWGIKERKLRHDAIAHMAPRAQRGEQVLDPRRSSSDLTPTGETRPEDEP